MSLSPTQTAIEAAIFDLDGVITSTESLHRDAWKETFDDYFEREHPDQPPFRRERDYREHVDGKPRYDGVRDFLRSRGIELPEGREGDRLEAGTVRGIGDAKNDRYQELLETRGAEVFEDAVERVRAWKGRGVPVAVASSSRNCRKVLETVGLLDLFDARVDGETLAELGLAGKPAPDMFVEAATRIGVPPARCAIFEDALSGVEAGRRGEFGLVVGIDRGGGRADEFRANGADVVVTTLEGFELERRP